MERIQLTVEHEEVIFVQMTERTPVEFVVVCGTGNVYLYDHVSQKNRQIGKVGFPLRYNEDHFNWFELNGVGKPFLQIASYGSYICIVQKYGQEGVVLHLEKSQFTKELTRGEYNVEHCSFPVAFYSLADATYLIHGTDWNRIDITHLESDRLLTERVVDYETDSNYFDYFHSSLSVSPDTKHFTSNGWFWGPCDVITVYRLDEFLSKFELANTPIDFGPVDGYNWDRPMCWIDGRTIGVGYNRKEAGENSNTWPSEIVFVDIILNKITGRIEFDGFALSDYGAAEGELYFDQKRDWFIGLNRQNGLLISDVNGNPLSSNKELTSHKYSPTNKVLYRTDIENQTVEMMKL